ncbi:MAG: glycosyltransferase, partial [Bacteroidota bacterium]
MARRRLVFVEQYYYPEGWGGAQLPRDITRHLARAGFDVHVICGSDRYVSFGAQTPDDPRVDGVTIHRIPRVLGGEIHEQKLLKQVWFYVAALPLLLFRKSPDLYITQTNPPLVVPLVLLAAALHRRPAMIIAQDLYPEVVFAHGMLSRRSFLGRILQRVFRAAYSRAACVISLGAVMSERLVAKGVDRKRIHLISNWATGALDPVNDEPNPLRQEWGLCGKFVLLYAG